MADERWCDLVLEGGGVKGVALAGAAVGLHREGYTFRRIAGSSAGAITGAVLAGLVHAGEPLERIEDITRTLDYRKFRDRGLLGRLLGPLDVVADGLSVLLDNGIFEGRYLHDWLTGVLADLGVRTFGDLREDDPDSALLPGQRYLLVVTASDLSGRRLARLPWDYPDYGLDPDDMRVADAVRASAAIPFYFEPVTVRGPRGASTLVDGGLLSNYPIELFDRTDDLRPRWPTIGIRVSGRAPEQAPVHEVHGPVSLALSVVETTIEACQARHVDDPCNVARSCFVETSGVSSVDFGITPEEVDALWAAGLEGAEKFLVSWDFDRWLHECRRP